MSTTLNHVAYSRARLAEASELADAGSTAHPASAAPRQATPQMQLYGGPRGAMNARGAEAAARGLTRAAAALRAAVKR